MTFPSLILWNRSCYDVTNTYRVIHLYFLRLQCNDSSMLYCSIWRLWSCKYWSDKFVSPDKENTLCQQLWELKHEAQMANMLDSTL